jgi:RNase P subunit RPR2
MTALFGTLFHKVTYSCHSCGARQRIPLRRVHVFERFHQLEDGEPVLIACPGCQAGLQIPSRYRTHTGHVVDISTTAVPQNAVIHAFY